MRPVVLALPRSGSAWLASYLGYLHDPILHRDPFLWGPNAGVVDTGAAYNPERVWQCRYGGGPAVVLLRWPKDAYESLVKLNHSVTQEDVTGWYEKLINFAHGNLVPIYWYHDIMAPHSGALHSLCNELLCEYDSIWAENARQLHIEHPYKYYTPDAWKRYVEWVDA